MLAAGKPIIYRDPQKLAVAVYESLPSAEVELVDDAGHGLNAEKADWVNARMLEFFASSQLNGHK